MNEQPSGLLPHDIQAEMATLGSMILSPKAFELAKDRLKPEDFYEHKHQHIFSAMLDLFDDKGTIDLVLLKNELEKTGKLEKIGGVGYLPELMESVPTSVNAEYYIELVRDNTVLRRILELRATLGDAARRGSEPDKILEQIQRFVEGIQSGSVKAIPPITDAILEATEYMEARSEGRLQGIETGIPPLDCILHGLQPGMLSIVGGRPGDGKTSVAENIICHACIEKGVPTLFFSVEMPAYQVVTNLQRILTGIDYSEVSRGTFTATNYDKWQGAAKRIAAAPLLLDDTGAISVSRIKQHVSRESRQRDVKLVIVDYIQLVRFEGARDRRLEVGGVTQELKGLAKNFNLHVLALSQLRRVSKDHPEHVLKESSEQEEAADVVILLGHDAKYGPGMEPEPPVARRKFLIDKNRHGRVGAFFMTFNKPVLRFEGVTDGESNGGDGMADRGLPAGHDDPLSQGRLARQVDTAVGEPIEGQDVPEDEIPF